MSHPGNIIGSCQCSQLGDPCDPSVCTGSPICKLPHGHTSVAGCFAPVPSVIHCKSPETLSHGCMSHPGNIMNDVSGVSSLSPVLDGPCDRSALGDGPSQPQATSALWLTHWSLPRSQTSFISRLWNNNRLWKASPTPFTPNDLLRIHPRLPVTSQQCCFDPSKG